MKERVEAARPESERIDFLLRRDGRAATRAWVERTARIYEAGITDPCGHATDPLYRPRFERAIEEFHAWLRDDGSSPEGSERPSGVELHGRG